MASLAAALASPPPVPGVGDAASPFVVPASNWTAGDGAEGQLLVLAPVLSNGMALLGEEHKLVPVSRVRFLDVAVTPEALVVTVWGVPGEAVTVLVAVALTGRHVEARSAAVVVRGSCAVPAGGHTRLLFNATGVFGGCGPPRR